MRLKGVDSKNKDRSSREGQFQPYGYAVPVESSAAMRMPVSAPIPLDANLSTPSPSSQLDSLEHSGHFFETVSDSTSSVHQQIRPPGIPPTLDQHIRFIGEPSSSSDHFPYTRHMHPSQLAFHSQLGLVSTDVEEHPPGFGLPPNFDQEIHQDLHGIKWPHIKTSAVNSQEEQVFAHQRTEPFSNTHTLDHSRSIGSNSFRDSCSTAVSNEGVSEDRPYLPLISDRSAEFSSSCTDLVSHQAIVGEESDIWLARRRHNSAPSTSAKCTNEIQYDSLGIAKNQCPECHKVFSRVSSLQVHTLVHSGYRPFKCPWPGCIKAFNVKSNMVRHYKIHERKFSHVSHDIRRGLQRRKSDGN